MTYLIRNLDPQLHQAIKIKAAETGKTIREIVIAAIEKAVKTRKS